MTKDLEWHCTTPDDFWGELAPVEHSVQIYRNDVEFLTTLEAFVSNGLQAGEAVILISTLAHRFAVEKRLKARGIDIARAEAHEQYIPLDARTSLASFMVDDYPDEGLFQAFVDETFTRGHRNGRRVRAFSEMVAMLWSQGHREATLRLEELWNKTCAEKALGLFCAYPHNGFTQDISASIAEICATHSKVITA